MVKLAELWQRKSAKGTTYFSGFMGDCVLLFKDGKKPHPTRPDEEAIIWKLLIQARDPERRPQRREQPTNDLSQGRTAVHKHKRRDPREERIEELAARFDARPPDEVPW